MDEQDIYALDTRELYNLYKRTVADTGKDYENETYQVKNGIKINVPIWYYTEQWYELHPENKRVTIKGHGKHPINEFMEELDAREDIMRKVIIENNEIIESEEPR